MLLPDAADRQAYRDAMVARGYLTSGSGGGSGQTTPGTTPKRQAAATD
jgi:hypothetical protein